MMHNGNISRLATRNCKTAATYACNCYCGMYTLTIAVAVCMIVIIIYVIVIAATIFSAHIHYYCCVGSRHC